MGKTEAPLGSNGDRGHVLIQPQLPDFVLVHWGPWEFAWVDLDGQISLESRILLPLEQPRAAL